MSASYSLRLLHPPVALLRRAVGRRWWIHTTGQSDRPLQDVPDFAGRQTFEDGVGDVIRRRYRITFPADGHTPEDLVTWFAGRTEVEAPVSYASFSDAITEVGQHLTVHLAGPWEGPVEVVAFDPTSILLATCNGHMEAGWIRFSAARADGDRLVFQIESAARAGDAAFWLLHAVAKVGQLVQSDMWASVLEGAARHFAAGAPLPRVVITTDRHPAVTAGRTAEPEQQS